MYVYMISFYIALTLKSASLEFCYMHSLYYQFFSKLILMWISPYIVSFEVVTCLVTSSTCVEVIRFRFILHNCYRSQNVQSYLLQLPLEVKYLMGSYSDEQGFCSYFKIVECGMNYKLCTQIHFENFLSVKGLSRCFPDGRPSCPQTTS